VEPQVDAPDDMIQEELDVPERTALDENVFIEMIADCLKSVSLMRFFA
jgi:hypothetical protein